MLEPRIEIVSRKKLVGLNLTMTFAENQTFRLWNSFMPRRNQISNYLTSELFSMQVYPKTFDFSFSNLNDKFQKWAAVEVIDFNKVPSEMQTFILPSGMYAVFNYKGLNTDTKIFEYIYGTWIQASKYSIDNRPHFEILGEKYKNNDPNSEEEIWIPIKLK